MDLTNASLKDLSEAIRTKKISARELTDHYLRRISQLDPQLNSYVLINEEAQNQAAELDKRISKGEVGGALLGIPIGIKDMLCTKGMRTSACSKILENFIPPYDATVVKKLKSQGAIILGKLNQDEFAMGSSNETSIFGPTRNPWNTEYVPGGSSGGSASAQAARIAVGTIGTDTGGSIRQPASFCGVVGLKPTYGRVSRFGIIAFASSLDQAGPFASTVEDAAILLESIAGHDTADATTSQRSVPLFSKNIKANIKGLKIGVLQEAFQEELHSDVEKAMQNGIAALKSAGAEIIPISLPLLQYSVSIYYLIASSEASSNLARYDGVRFGYRAEMQESALSLEEFYSKTRGQGFGQEVQRRIMIGTYCLSSGYSDAYYQKACRARRLLKNEYDDAFAKCDIILSPVTTTPAFKLGDRFQDPLSMYLNDLFTTSVNLAGLPAISVPFSLSRERLPIGLQLTGRAFDEQTVFNVGSVLELASSTKGEKPHVI